MGTDISLTEIQNLRPIWNVLLEIYKAFDVVCQKHGLVHYVGYGTLLGAIRHGGFIPWDDDFDVIMPRPDYERFISLRDELPENLRWQSLETDRDYELLFGKIREVRPQKLDSVQKASGLSLAQGLFIDVFPMDGFPSNPFAIFAWRVGRAIRRRLCSGKKLQTWFKKRQYETSRYVGFANNELSDVSRFFYPKEALGTPRRLKFDNILVNVPEEPEKILSLDYGNWRELPPVEKRIPSHQALQ